jgi:aryl-alcohol dehydrogenase-like predicted oxidoreductase
MVDPKKTISASSVRKECEESLRRLGVDCIDLYQIHWPDESGAPIEAAWEAMLSLKGEGKVRAVGVSNFDLELLERCESVGHVDSLQPPFSLIKRDAAIDVIPWCATHGTGVLAYSPMQSGLLGGRYSRERVAKLSPRDFRLKTPEFSEPNLSRNLALADALRPVADRHGVGTAAIAIAWASSWPGVTGSIVGARAASDVDQWIAGAALKLTRADHLEVERALQETGAGNGPLLAARR